MADAVKVALRHVTPLSKQYDQVCKLLEESVGKREALFKTIGGKLSFDSHRDWKALYDYNRDITFAVTLLIRTDRKFRSICGDRMFSSDLLKQALEKEPIPQATKEYLERIERMLILNLRDDNADIMKLRSFLRKQNGLRGEEEVCAIEQEMRLLCAGMFKKAGPYRDLSSFVHQTVPGTLREQEVTNATRFADDGNGASLWELLKFAAEAEVFLNAVMSIVSQPVTTSGVQAANGETEKIEDVIERYQQWKPDFHHDLISEKDQLLEILRDMDIIPAPAWHHVEGLYCEWVGLWNPEPCLSGSEVLVYLKEVLARPRLLSAGEQVALLGFAKALLRYYYEKENIRMYLFTDRSARILGIFAFHFFKARGIHDAEIRFLNQQTAKLRYEGKILVVDEYADSGMTLTKAANLLAPEVPYYVYPKEPPKTEVHLLALFVKYLIDDHYRMKDSTKWPWSFKYIASLSGHPPSWYESKEFAGVTEIETTGKGQFDKVVPDLSIRGPASDIRAEMKFLAELSAKIIR